MIQAIVATLNTVTTEIANAYLLTLDLKQAVMIASIMGDAFLTQFVTEYNSHRPLNADQGMTLHTLMNGIPMGEEYADPLDAVPSYWKDAIGLNNLLRAHILRNMQGKPDGRLDLAIPYMIRSFLTDRAVPNVGKLDALQVDDDEVRAYIISTQNYGAPLDGYDPIVGYAYDCHRAIDAATSEVNDLNNDYDDDD